MQVYLDKMNKQEEATEECSNCGNMFKKSDMYPGLNISLKCKSEQETKKAKRNLKTMVIWFLMTLAVWIGVLYYSLNEASEARAAI